MRLFLLAEIVLQILMIVGLVYRSRRPDVTFTKLNDCQQDVHPLADFMGHKSSDPYHNYITLVEDKMSTGMLSRL